MSLRAAPLRPTPVPHTALWNMSLRHTPPRATVFVAGAGATRRSCWLVQAASGQVEDGGGVAGAFSQSLLRALVCF